MADTGQKVSFLVGCTFSFLARIRQLFFGTLPLRDVAQHGAETAGVWKLTHCHEEGDKPSLSFSTNHFPAVVQDAENTIFGQPVQIIHRCTLALDRKQHREEFAFGVSPVIAEKGGGRMIHRANATFGINQHNAICCRVENNLKFFDLSFKCLLFSMVFTGYFGFCWNLNFVGCRCNGHKAQHERTTVAPANGVEMCIYWLFAAVCTAQHHTLRVATFITVTVK